MNVGEGGKDNSMVATNGKSSVPGVPLIHLILKKEIIPNLFW